MRTGATGSPSTPAAARVRSRPIASSSPCRSRSSAASTTRKQGSRRSRTRRSAELGMGTNSKLHVQFSDRFWNSLGNQGETYADTGYQNTWEVTRAQTGEIRDPGRLHRWENRGELRQRHADGSRNQFLAQIEPVLPGSPHAGTAKRRSTSGPAMSGPRAPTPTGRSVSTRSSQARSASRKGPVTSPESTRRSTSRAT